MKEFIVTRSEQFRTPSRAEREIGLWVDRIGQGKTYHNVPESLRILGLYAVVAVSSGHGTFISTVTGEEPVKEHAGMMLFPSVPCQYYPEREWHCKWIVWNGPEADRLIRMNYFITEKPIIENAYALVNEAHSQLSATMGKEDLETVFERKNCLLNLLHQLYRCSINQQPSQLHKNIVEDAIEYMTKSVSKVISVSDVAQHCNLSDVHFRRIFKAQTGSSPKEFMLNQKISKAKEYLSYRIPVKEVADMLGYNDEFYFRRIFKKVTGKTPGNF